MGLNRVWEVKNCKKQEEGFGPCDSHLDLFSGAY